MMEIRLGDVVRLRKQHPCGGYEWEVVRLGADIGLRCQKCRRSVLLERRILERRVKAFLARGPEPPPEGAPDELADFVGTPESAAGGRPLSKG